MTTLQPVRILIIEDEPMIAFGLEELLVSCGYDVAGVAVKLPKALLLIERGAFDLAIVDANLAGVSASPAGSALAARGSPYIVLSGYSTIQLAGAFPGAELFLQKPCIPAKLIEGLSKISHTLPDRGAPSLG